MIPIRVQAKGLARPYSTWAVALICAAVLVRLATLPAQKASSIGHALGAVPARFLASPLSPGQLVTLVTSAFLHSGWVHLIGNLLFLLVFGPVVEDRLGWRRFLGLYLASGVAGTLAHIAAHPVSTAPLVGASGAIAGVLGAHLVLSPRSKVTTIIPIVIYFEVATLPAAFVIALWFLLQVASAVAPVGATGAPVAWFAHLGGFTAGALLASLNQQTKKRGTARIARSLE